MSLIDTTDNILMLGAYGWAFVKPVRKLYYNLTITFVSVVVALAVGGIEALGLLAGHFGLNGFFWNFVRRLNGNFGELGYFIVGIFALSWIASHGDLQMAAARRNGIRRLTFSAIRAARTSLPRLLRHALIEAWRVSRISGWWSSGGWPKS